MRAADAAGIVRLTGLGARGVRSVVERTHLAVQQSTYRAIGSAIGSRTTTVARAHDGYVAGIHRLVDLGLLGAEHLARAIVTSRVSGDTALTDSSRAAPVLAVINGLYGDRLHGAEHTIAPGITLRADQADVPLTDEGLSAGYPDARGRLVVFVHGLMETDASWTFRATKRHGRADASYASMLANDIGCSSLLVRYNTGLPVADNGLALAALMSAVVRHWPVPVRDIVLIGHSMGGLVVHSALAQTDSNRGAAQSADPARGCSKLADAQSAGADRADPERAAPEGAGTELANNEPADAQRPDTEPADAQSADAERADAQSADAQRADVQWADLVSATVTLGTPYLGAPLERGAAALARRAEKAAPVRWLAELVAARSEGIRDLGAGLGPHAALPPTTAVRRHYLVAATVIPGAAGPLRDLMGDVMVPTASAAGGYEIPFTDDGRVTVLHLPGHHHMDLLNAPAVYEQLLGWLADDRGRPR